MCKEFISMFMSKSSILYIVICKEKVVFQSSSHKPCVFTYDGNKYDLQLINNSNIVFSHFFRTAEGITINANVRCYEDKLITCSKIGHENRDGYTEFTYCISDSLREAVYLSKIDVDRWLEESGKEHFDKSLENLLFDFVCIKEIKTEDGKLLRTTTTNSRHNFTFLGDTYNMDTIKNALLIHTYHNSSNSEASLWQDKYNRLFFKIYQEEMNFNGEDDCVECTYCFIDNKKIADELYQKGTTLCGIEPYIYVSSDGLSSDFVSVHEYISASS